MSTDAPPTDATVLRDYLSLNDGRCPACDYSLRGLGSDACPECNTALRLTIDHGPLFETGSGPPLTALACGAVALTGLTAAIYTGNLLSFLIDVRGQSGGTTWLNVVCRGLVLGGAIATIPLALRARSPAHRRSVVVRWALLLAIASQAIQAFLLTLQLTHFRF